MANPRSQYTINRQSDNDFSEDHWLKQFEKSLQKGAVQPRKQQSLFDQINSIMNTNSKYNSVEAVVDDMKERSGLTAYLKKAKRTEIETSTNVVIKNASKEDESNIVSALKAAVKSADWHGTGKLMASLELVEGNPATNAMDNVFVFKYFHDPELKHVKIPVDAWNDFTVGYCEGRGMTDDETQKQLEFTHKIAEKHGKKFASDKHDKKHKLPTIIQKVPNILDTLKNCINDSKGNLSIPAIIERVHSIHHNDVSDSKDWDDDDLMYLVSQLNLEAKSNNPTNYEDSTNLGKHDSHSNQEIDPSNTDAFFALNPARF
jgi:hypothetical protein